MLKLTSISKLYHNKYEDHLALDHIDISIEENKGLVFLLGPSGSGKSTILNIIADIDKDYTGEREIEGKLVYIFQGFRLFDNMSLLDNLLIIDNDLTKINKYINLFKLEEFKDRKVYKLSNGQKKRLELIKALLLDPDILLCDELTSALDHDNSVLVMNILKELSKSVLIIMVTHDEDLANNYADRIIRIFDAKVISDTLVHPLKEREVKEKVDLFKNIKDHFTLILKDLKSRFIYYSFFVLALILCVVAVYISINLYRTISEQNSLINTFKYGRNMIETSSSKVQERNYGQRGSEEDIYSSNRYELYFPNDIQNFLDEHPEIMAIEAYWDPSKNKTISTNGEELYFESGNDINKDPDSEDAFKIIYQDSYGVEDILQYAGFFENIYYDSGTYRLGEINEGVSNFTIEYENHFKTPEELGLDPGLLAAGIFPMEGRIFSNDVINLHPYRTPFIMIDAPYSKVRSGDGSYYLTYEVNSVSYNLYDDFSLHIYHLLKDDNLNLMYGKAPESENEVVLDVNAASAYSEYLGIEVKDLVGQKIKLGMYAVPYIGLNWDANKDAMNTIAKVEEQLDVEFDDLLLHEYEVVISGISSLQVADKRVAFMNTAFDDDMFIESFQKQIASAEYEEFHEENDYYNYPFMFEGNEPSSEQIGEVYFDSLSFLVDPNEDYDELRQAVQSYFRPEYDRIVIKGDIADDSGLFYKDIKVFFPFVVAVTILILTVPFIMAIFDKKRDKKENELMQSYGYKVNLVYVFKYAIITLIFTLLSSFILYFITLFFNDYAKTYNYTSFLYFDPLVIVLLAVIVGLLTALFRKVVAR